MRLYNGQTRQISRDMLDELLKKNAIEVGEGADEEARLDVESILKEYIRLDREISDLAREMVREQGLGSGAFQRTKKRLAKERDFYIGEEAVTWITDQAIEMLLVSQHVEEVFAADRELRVILRDVLRRYADVENDLDREVRSKLKNLEEGNVTWEVEYQRAMDSLKRQRGLS